MVILTKEIAIFKLYSATNLYPEGTYSVTTNANNVHNGFTGFGNGGSGNFMALIFRCVVPRY